MRAICIISSGRAASSYRVGLAACSAVILWAAILTASTASDSICIDEST